MSVFLIEMYSMDLDKKGIMISMFQLAEQGEFTKLEQKDIVDALFSFGMSRIVSQIPKDSNKSSQINIQEEFKRIRLGSRRLLEQTENCIDTALEMLDNYQSYIEKALGDINELPKYAEYGDTIETIKLIKALDKELYNFSHAEKLLGTSRQTLKKHAEANKDGLKIIQSGGSKYLHREDMIIYFRAKHKDKNLPF